MDENLRVFIKNSDHQIWLWTDSPHLGIQVLHAYKLDLIKIQQLNLLLLHIRKMQVIKAKLDLDCRVLIILYHKSLENNI